MTVERNYVRLRSLISCDVQRRCVRVLSQSERRCCLPSQSRAKSKPIVIWRMRIFPRFSPVTCFLLEFWLDHKGRCLRITTVVCDMLTTRIGHFRVAFCLCFKTSPGAQLRNGTRFETEAIATTTSSACKPKSCRKHVACGKKNWTVQIAPDTVINLVLVLRLE